MCSDPILHNKFKIFAIVCKVCRDVNFVCSPASNLPLILFFFVLNYAKFLESYFPVTLLLYSSCSHCQKHPLSSPGHPLMFKDSLGITSAN